MQLRSGRETVRSPHASPIPTPKVREEEGADGEELPVPDEPPLQKAARLAAKGLWALTKWS